MGQGMKILEALRSHFKVFIVLLKMKSSHRFFYKEINHKCSIRVSDCSIRVSRSCPFSKPILAKTHIQKGFTETFGNPFSTALLLVINIGTHIVCGLERDRY